MIFFYNLVIIHELNSSFSETALGRHNNDWVILCEKYNLLSKILLNKEVR